MSIFHLKAPGKINLRLKITGQREDGYHLLDMVMVKVDLADEMVCDLTDGDIQIVSNEAVLPVDERNILWKVIDCIRKESEKSFGVTIQLTKRIPIAAGMGGGSSDAAALLLGLNDQLGLGWSHEKLISIGVRIGSDVPFFLVSGAQRVTGVGEILEPVSVSSMPLILMNPGFPLSTPDVYRWYDEWALTAPAPDAKSLPLENDLEKVVLPRIPVLEEIRRKLDRSGALGSLMSGSGPTVFGTYPSTEARDRGYNSLLKEIDPKWWIWSGTTLT